MLSTDLHHYFFIQLLFSFSSSSTLPWHDPSQDWIWISAETKSLLVQCLFLVVIHILSRNQNAIKINEYEDYFLTFCGSHSCICSSIHGYWSKNGGWSKYVFYVSIYDIRNTLNIPCKHHLQIRETYITYIRGLYRDKTRVDTISFGYFEAKPLQSGLKLCDPNLPLLRTELILKFQDEMNPSFNFQK